MKVSKRAKRRAYRKTGGPPSIGNNCKSYEQGCVVCEAYRFLDTYKRFPTWEEMRNVIDEVSKYDTNRY
jgi:hypothetical protein